MPAISSAIVVSLYSVPIVSLWFAIGVTKCESKTKSVFSNLRGCPASAANASVGMVRPLVSVVF